MGLFDFIKDLGGSAASTVGLDLSAFEKKPNKEIGEAGVAFLLGVFRCDGSFDAAEQEAYDKIIGNHRFFRIFDKHQSHLSAKKRELNGQFTQFGLEDGLDACLDELGDIRSEDQAIRENLVRLTLRAAGADGLSEPEKAFIRRGVARLGLEASSFPELA